VSTFADVIAAQLRELEAAMNAYDVLRILSKERNPYGADHANSGQGFFAGDGDDVMEALTEAGWRCTWSEASYYFVMEAPDGSQITYIEGDIEQGDTHR
jgi:hypothetical protein